MAKLIPAGTTLMIQRGQFVILNMTIYGEKNFIKSIDDARKRISKGVTSFSETCYLNGKMPSVQHVRIALDECPSEKKLAALRKLGLVEIAINDLSQKYVTDRDEIEHDFERTHALKNGLRVRIWDILPDNDGNVWEVVIEKRHTEWCDTCNDEHTEWREVKVYRFKDKLEAEEKYCRLAGIPAGVIDVNDGQDN